MLAKRIPTIMPELTLQEALEVTKIHSVSGELLAENSFMRLRPFRMPHHTISCIALVGGGSLPHNPERSVWRTKGCCF
jgi:magnesium chelatase family protein